MPPHSDLPCPNCGRLFFAHSLPFHLKKCEARGQPGYGDSLGSPKTVATAIAAANVSYVNRGPLAPREFPCSHCGSLVFPTALKAHERVCPALHPELAGIGRDPSGPFNRRGRASQRTRLEDEEPADTVALPLSEAAGYKGRVRRFEENGRFNGLDRPFTPAGGGRLPCRVCGRVFDAERIDTHEGICVRLSWNRDSVECMEPGIVASIPERKAPWEKGNGGGLSASNEPSADNTLVYRTSNKRL